MMVCKAPSPPSNHRTRQGSGKKRGDHSPPQEQQGSLDSIASVSAQSTPCNGWEETGAWEDLSVCVSCGFVGCLSQNHFKQHFQEMTALPRGSDGLTRVRCDRLHPKHFVSFRAAYRTFWSVQVLFSSRYRARSLGSCVVCGGCFPCQQEILDAPEKLEQQRRECEETFIEIASKNKRKWKQRLYTSSSVLSSDSQSVSPPPPPLHDGAASDTIESDTPRTSPPTTASLKDKCHRKKSRDVVSCNGNKLTHEATSESESSLENRATGVVGFSNLGNTCYFNAATQAMVTTAHYFPLHFSEEVLEKPQVPVASTFILLNETIKKKAGYDRSRPVEPEDDGTDDADDDEPRNKSGRRAKADKKQAKDGVTGKRTRVLTVSPLLKEIRRKFSQFRGHNQQDAHELLLSFLWAVDEELDPPKASGEDTDSHADKTTGSSANTKQIFVKTEDGQTISMQVADDTTVEQLRSMLAERLQLDEVDMLMSRNGRSASVRKASSSGPRAEKDNNIVPVGAPYNFARRLFSGQLVNVVTCAHCGNKSKSFEDSFQLSLSIPSATRDDAVSIQDCLKAFAEVSRLEVCHGNGYDCEKCSRASADKGDAGAAPILRDATMRHMIARTPLVLVLHLKRLCRTKKISHHVSFPATLGLSDNMLVSGQERCTYELMATVVHMGNRRSGHYVAYVSRLLGPPDAPVRRWYYVSDSTVTVVEEEQVLRCEAYMLFYRRIENKS
ncbi:TPA: hypothetical protein N0F65_002787 [Lagenidium giganteum]|uniref:ubiquitinyl hydrolase 1 n=1 Tax=Lagenidium giganteum TaxID=4803 RepID=A0AAV2YNZ7_9STRA|nr:TPA: hypothetical protein N0F65_002787 [Lagenidium giganteum]